MSRPFDFDKALKTLQLGQTLIGSLVPIINQLIEAVLGAELDSNLAQDVEANRKNGFVKRPSKPRPAASN